jgi:hypothetical protein
MHAADINSDGRVEVLAGANKYIHIISDTGKLISSWSPTTKGSETKSIEVRSIYAGDLDGDGGKEVAAGFGWIDNPLDQRYSKGDIQVFKVNKDYVSSPPAQEEKEETEVTTSTEPPAKKATTTSATTTQPEKEGEPAEETATTIAGAQEKPKAEMPWMILIIAGMGLFLLIVSILVFFLVFKKKPPEKKEPEISKT